MIRKPLLLILALSLSGCLTHWVVDTDTRLQIDNRLPYSVADLRVYAPEGSAPDIAWMPDTLVSGKRSSVYDKALVGTLFCSISTRDSLCGQDTCWRRQSLGKQDLPGGSVIWRLEPNGSAISVVIP